MAKLAKIDDVKRPDGVTPSATARPIIVGNHSMVPKDPMMASAGDAQPAGEPAPGGAVMKHEKTIIPLNSISVESEEDKEETPDAPKEAESKTEEAKPDEAIALEAETTRLAPEPKQEPQEAVMETGTSGLRDSAAEVTAEETAVAEAKAKREQELEDIITSGKYAVPIDAVQRRRSHIATMLLCVLALLLAVALLDAAADVGLAHVPSSVPHTHFFSKH